MNSIQTSKRGRGNPKKPASILADFEGTTQDFKIENVPPQFWSHQDADPESFKVAVDGILGLASLIANSDFDTPQDWVQPFPIAHKDHSTLPTGIPLTTQKLLRDSYEVYFNIQNNS